jgi:hypothetical protein
MSPHGRYQFAARLPTGVEYANRDMNAATGRIGLIAKGPTSAGITRGTGAPGEMPTS